MQKRGLVFVPTGSAAADFYGANRLGDNLYANCLLALDAATGKLRWHFQFVKHDVLDRDLPTAPTLVTLRVKGKPVDALVQTTKQGFVFVLDRDTGKPVFPVEEVPAPASDVPGEVASPTYLRPRLPAPYARQRLTADDLTTRTPEANRWAREQFAQLRSDGPFKPLGVGVDTTIYPGFDGGAEWGGPAFDPDTRPALRELQRNGMARLAGAQRHRPQHRQIHLPARLRRLPRRQRPGLAAAVSFAGRTRRPHDAEQFAERVRKGGGRMPAFPHLQDEALDAIAAYLYRRRAMCRGRARRIARQPAISLHGLSPLARPGRISGGRHALGHAQRHRPRHRQISSGAFLSVNFPSSRRAACKDTGSENYGGPLVTAGGLLFIGATIHDRKFRAFDKANGKLLWETTLPFSADATPITYQVDGRQYVAIFASGGKERDGAGGGVYLSYALPCR